MLTVSICLCNLSFMSNAAKTSKREAETYHHGDLRRALIASALELAAEDRNWDFSLREVARRAGVSHGAPYNHFAHKRDLLAAAAVAGHELLRTQLLAAATKAKDPRTALLRMGSAYVKFGIENAALYRLIFTAALSGHDWHPEAIIKAGAETRATLEEILRTGAATGTFSPALTRKMDLQAASVSAWATVHGFTLLAIDGLANVGQVSIERLTDKVLAMVLHGLSGKKASKSDV